MKRYTLILILVALLALFAAACTSAPTQAPAAEKQATAVPTEKPAEKEATADKEEMAEEPAKEAVMLEMYHDKSTWEEKTNAMGEAAAEQTGIGWKTVPFADTTNYQATVRASLGTDSAPDLFTWWSGYRMEDIVKSGAAEDLTAVWKKYIDNGEYSQDVANAFAFDGKIYAVPLLTANWVVYYNKKLFDEKGLKPPTTWKEFMTLNDTLVEAGVTPMAVTIDGRWPSFILFEEMILRTAGPDFYNKLTQGKAKYTDPEVVNAMTVWKDMIDKGYFTDPGIPFGTGENAILPIFQKGEVAMIPIGDWYSTTLSGGGLVAGEDYDAFIMPNMDPDLPPALFFEAAPLLVGAKSANKEAAIKAVDWWMSVPAQDQWGELNGFTSANAKAAPTSSVGAGIQKWIADNNATLVQRYWEATPPDIVEVAVDEFARFMTNPDTMDEVLKNIQSKADEVWASY